jgi:hypothetical protein
VTFGLNHPKNYFGLPAAIAAEGDTGGLVMGHLVSRQFGVVRRGAAELGLVDADLGLTSLGEDVAAFGVDQYGSHEATLTQFKSWQRTQTRFIDLNDGEWGQMAARVLQCYEPAVRIASVLNSATGELTLPEFVAHAGRADPTVAEWFLAESLRDSVDVSALDALDTRLEPARAYRSTAVCQLKGVLYHCGVLTHAGASSDTLVPETDVWALDTQTGCVPTVLAGAPADRAVVEGSL